MLTAARTVTFFYSTALCWHLHELSPFNTELIIVASRMNTHRCMKTDLIHVDGCMNCHHFPVAWTVSMYVPLVCFLLTVAWTVTIYHWSASCWWLHELSPFNIYLLLVDSCVNCHHLTLNCFLLTVAWTVNILIEASESPGSADSLLFAIDFLGQWKAISSGNGR